MLRALLISVAAISLAATSSAQQKQSASTERATTAQYAGTYSPDTGLVAPSSGVAKFGPVSLWNNNTLTNYYSVPGMDQEWVDEGTLVDRNLGSLDQVNGLEFTYCSTVPDMTQDSISSTIRFYAETVYCLGPTAWPTADCTYGLQGLPGGDPSGLIQCWIIAIDLAGGFECELATNPASGLFGWSNTYDQDDTGPWLASGGPGNTDSFVSYDTTAASGSEFQGCFFFGGPPFNPFAGFATKMFGAPTDVMTDLSCPANLYTLSANNAADIGSSISFDVNTISASRLIISLFDSPPLEIVPGGFLCCNLAGIVYDSISASGNHTTPVIGPGFTGITLCVQAADQPVTGLSNVLLITGQ